MTNQQLREAVEAQPFQPFKIRMAAGPTLEVRHPEFVALHPGLRTFVYFDYPNRAYRIIDLLHAQEIQYQMDPPADAPDPPELSPAEAA